MSNHLFLFTIGPVQSFIAQARKTQDLYAGSKLLSDLCLEGLKEVINNHSANPIFPFVEKHKVTKEYIFNNEIKSYPNRFLVEFTFHEKPTDEFINKIGECISKRVQDKLIDISQKLLPKKDNGNLPIGAIEQIEDFLQVYWVIIPFEKDDDYKLTFTKIERYLGAVKNVRTFKQLHYQNNGKDFGEVGRKCSLNGEYNVKFYNANESDIKNAIRKIQLEKKEETHNPTDFEIAESISKNKLFLEDFTEIQMYSDFEKPNKNGQNDFKFKKIDSSKLQLGEGLSAISMLKRLYEVENFPSTADISLLETLKYLKSDVKKSFPLITEYSKLFYQHLDKLDGQLFYEENLTDKYFKDHGYNNAIENISLIKSKQKDIETYVKSKDLKLTKYYAILTFDGDSMGKWLSGDNLSEGSDLLKFHKSLSGALSNFASWATNYINDKDNSKGRAVYAGGDDFLAFINLNHLFDVMQKLRDEYRIRVSEPLKDFKKDENKELTFSAGVAIAHYKIPLSIVLKEARRMQEQAKEIDKEKDAFGITVLKHSGETPSTRMKWNYEKESVMKIALDLQYLLGSKDKSISDKFIYTFHKEFSKLMNQEGLLEIQENQDEIIKSELSRLVQRACSNSFTKDEKNQIDSFIKEKVILLYKNSLVNGNNNLINFINCLYIINFVSKNINLPSIEKHKFFPIEISNSKENV
jgi:CRISPR-associated protein Cmr2